MSSFFFFLIRMLPLLQRARVAELERRKQIAEANKQARLEEERLKKLDDIRKEREREAAAQAEKEERRKRKEALESELKDIPSALRYVEENYEISRLQEMCKVSAYGMQRQKLYHAAYPLSISITSTQLLSTIVRNILNNPKDPKYRSINTLQPTVHRAITRPTGGLLILRCLGFDPATDDGLMQLRDKNVNLALLSNELARFQHVLNKSGREARACPLHSLPFGILTLRYSDDHSPKAR